MRRWDDERGDYQAPAGDHLAFRYEVIAKVGCGSFGQARPAPPPRPQACSRRPAPSGGAPAHAQGGAGHACTRQRARLQARGRALAPPAEQAGPRQHARARMVKLTFAGPVAARCSSAMTTGRARRWPSRSSARASASTSRASSRSSCSTTCAARCRPRPAGRRRAPRAAHGQT